MDFLLFLTTITPLIRLSVGTERPQVLWTRLIDNRHPILVSSRDDIGYASNDDLGNLPNVDLKGRRRRRDDQRKNCNTWYPWLNDNHPGPDNNYSDTETLSQHTISEFCPSSVGGNVTDFQCADLGGEPRSRGRLTDTTSYDGECINVTDGVKCWVLNDNPGTKCPDMAIRFKCTCPEYTTVSSVDNDEHDKTSESTTKVSDILSTLTSSPSVLHHSLGAATSSHDRRTASYTAYTTTYNPGSVASSSLKADGRTTNEFIFTNSLETLTNTRHTIDRVNGQETSIETTSSQSITVQTASASHSSIRNSVTPFSDYTSGTLVYSGIRKKVTATLSSGTFASVKIYSDMQHTAITDQHVVRSNRTHTILPNLNRSDVKPSTKHAKRDDVIAKLKHYFPCIIIALCILIMIPALTVSVRRLRKYLKSQNSTVEPDMVGRRNVPKNRERGALNTKVHAIDFV